MKIRIWTGLVAGLLSVLASMAAFAAPPSAGEADMDSRNQSVGAGGAVPLTFLASEVPPFASLEDGEPVGFAVEILHEIMHRLGRADRIEFGDWPIVYRRGLREPGTVLLPPSRTPEREKLFKWVGPLIPEKLVLFARRDSDLVVESIEDAKKVGSIATARGYASEKLLVGMGFENLASQRSPMQGPDALKFGRVDLWLSSNITMERTALAANVDPDLFKPLFVLEEIPSYLAFSASVPDEVVNQWQGALDGMKKDGSWERIVSNWIPSELLKIGQPAVEFSERERLWIQSNSAVKVVRSFHQPPFVLDEGGAPSGYLYDLLSEVLSMAGLGAEFVGGFSSYDSMIDALKDGRVDILPNLNSTRSLSGDIVRSVPVVRTPNVLVAKVGTSEIVRTSDLFGKKVAVVKGYAQDQHLDGFPEIVKVHVGNNEEGFEAVRSGRAEFFLNNLANAGYVLKKNFATDLGIAGTLSYVDFPPLALSFGIHGNGSPLPGIVNKALDNVPAKALSRLRAKWLAEDFIPASPGRIALTPEERAFLRGHPVLRVAFDVDWPPVEFFGEGGELKGMAADYLEKMGPLLGVAFQPGEPRIWREMLVAVENGELDFFSAISPTSRRREWMDFTDTYLSFPIVILTSQEVSYIGGMSDLAGKPVAVVDGYASQDLMLENHPDLTLLPVRDVKEGLMAVSTGKAFAFVGSLATASHVISREGLADLKVSGETPYVFDVAMGTRKENAVLVKILNKALASISLQERNAIYGKWTSVTFEHTTDYSLIWCVSAVALIAVLVVLCWNRRLKKEIVERKRAEKAAEAANRSKSTFLANMSHELRTPLNTVLGFANIVSKSSDLSAEDRENLDIVRRSGEHLLTLINDILDLSRIEAGNVGLNEEVFDLFHLLDDLKLMFEQKIRKKGLRLEFVRKKDLPRHIKADQVKLRQVLINLIGNAVKFARQGGVTITAGSTGPSSENGRKTGGGRVSFAIEDTGPGIAEADFEKIFNPFMQTETGRRLNQGAGLGLSISRRFVQAMGGEISVESALGKGTVFRFHIELRERPDVERSTGPENLPAVGLAPDQPGCRILIVDDVAVNRFLLKSILGSGNFEVREAEDGQQAVEIWRRWRPRLIWMDIRMPVVDGYEATRTIREEERKSEECSVPTVIVAVSAGVFEEQREKALKAGCDDFVPKPLDDSVIFEKMRNHLRIECVLEEHVDERHVDESHAHKDHGDRKVRRGNGDGGPTGGSGELTLMALEGLPADWLETLRQGARRADFTLIAGVIEQIRERDADTAETLGRLADDFRYDEILALLPQADRETSD